MTSRYKNDKLKEKKIEKISKKKLISGPSSLQQL